ncbi:Gfo/Idh/MocA family protein [Cryobacterium ruanii]|nr:Gfo/Idh/MocA family oxidoreductase [Cryobacterium ruanii]
MNERRRLRAGIIGGGFMAEVHARAIRANGHHASGINSSTRDSTYRAADRLGISQRFKTAEDLIHAPDIDVIHICTPNALHAQLAHAAIGAGKSVVCEKPLTTSLSDAKSLVAAAARASVATAVPFVYRYYSAVREIRGRIDAGEAGQLHLLHGSYLQDWLATKTDTNWRVDAAQGGDSRAFADIGVHWCDLMEFVTGHRITRLSAKFLRAYEQRGGDARIRGVGTEDASTVVFETDRGAAGTVTVSQISRGRKNRLWFSFEGSESSFEFNQENPDSFWVGGLRENRIITRGTSGIEHEDARRVSPLPAGHPSGYQDAFNVFMGDAYQSFANEDGERPTGLPTFEDGLRAAYITDAVIRASQSEQWVAVDPFCGVLDDRQTVGM